mmetsp:Transcript_13804/g.27586  ORF Transcript_13804/g.27586 Transcript_13804/m.27586 type:complete len:131 (+) Transcript_13804:787-1179(+)
MLLVCSPPSLHTCHPAVLANIELPMLTACSPRSPSAAAPRCTDPMTAVPYRVVLQASTPLHNKNLSCTTITVFLGSGCRPHFDTTSLNLSDVFAAILSNLAEFVNIVTLTAFRTGTTSTTELVSGEYVAI